MVDKLRKGGGELYLMGDKLNVVFGKVFNSKLGRNKIYYMLSVSHTREH
jgi:hypothetical protein